MNFPFQLSDKADFDVVGFGTNAVDHLIQVAEYPAFNSKVEFLQYTRDAGGEVATTLVGLQRLGFRTAYVGRFGDDREGEFGLETLAAEGVELSYAERVAGGATQIAFVVIDKKTGERTIIWHRDKKLRYETESAPIEAAGRCKVLHLTPHDTGACVRMAARAKECGVIVSIDIDNVFDGLDELLPLVDILIASPEFSHEATGSPDHKIALRTMHERYGCGVVGTTRGQAGSIFLCEGVFTETKAFEVPGGCIDTTGAGDAFRAGFLYGLLVGKPLEESARIANAVAALKCRMLGARAGLPSIEELASFTKNL